ncbi:hypothetical protein ABIC71_000924 [Herbaspirillum seropedicae]|uniref:hypothetical protein n=1 Tax=Herbaspirillum seropedicae TaxID=964 RepID=UPI00339578BE
MAIDKDLINSMGKLIEKTAARDAAYQRAKEVVEKAIKSQFQASYIWDVKVVFAPQSIKNPSSDLLTSWPKAEHIEVTVKVRFKTSTASPLAGEIQVMFTGEVTNHGVTYKTSSNSYTVAERSYAVAEQANALAAEVESLVEAQMKEVEKNLG